ncbi:hypothetical protein [Riemerella anatipestifer]|uniref:hypothetical protein n=1 Tax=Riemerella anatipestifer TaxID=34085 RepID=UPI00129E8FE5|nr:hypothetical protein [Riemerella anatipestifer]MRM84278.1 hypothetical protein [Riemerella anatipestifer]
MRKFFTKGALVATIFGVQFTNAQTFGLKAAGEKFMGEVAGAFPYIAGILFVFAAWKALDEYSQSKDVLAALKIILWFALALVVIVGIYQFVKGQSL